MLNWVANNALKANPDKFHLLLSHPDESITVNVDGYQTTSSKREELFGITIDNKLSFDEHVSCLCTKANQKLHALARVSKYINTDKLRLIMKAFVNAQFGYCPLVWMFHSRSLNIQINKRALRIVFKDKNATCNELLQRDVSVTIHERKIQALATEMFKVFNGIFPIIIKDVFRLRNPTTILLNSPFKTRNVRTVTYGTETLGYLGLKIWSLVPEEIKNANNLGDFKIKINRWRPVGSLAVTE